MVSFANKVTEHKNLSNLCLCYFLWNSFSLEVTHVTWTRENRVGQKDREEKREEGCRCKGDRWNVKTQTATCIWWHFQFTLQPHALACPKNSWQRVQWPLTEWHSQFCHQISSFLLQWLNLLSKCLSRCKLISLASSVAKLQVNLRPNARSPV